MKILWTETALQDRAAIFDFLVEFNPDVAVKVDDIIAEKVRLLADQPLMGTTRLDRTGRCLIIPEIQINVFYRLGQDGDSLLVAKVMHQKQLHMPLA